MRKNKCLVFAVFVMIFAKSVFSTFSICAVDTNTKEVGSAGASCIDGAIILSDPIPGLGVIHTQAFYNASNQNYARSLMEQGKSPKEVVDGVVNNDAQVNSSIRQYGAVDLIDEGRSAGFSGSGCQDYKNHITGKNYAIQGNILKGKEILDSMETRFLNTEGALSDKLMAALQGAKVPGADTRCLRYNKSTISAFIRVARPDDPENDLYLDLNVDDTSPSEDPIDKLQVLYDEWCTTYLKHSENPLYEPRLFQNRPNPFSHYTNFTFQTPSDAVVLLKIISPNGKEIKTLINQVQPAGLHNIKWNGTNNKGESIVGGIYIYILKINNTVQTKKLILLR